LGSRRETGLHKQARERLAEPLGKRLDIFRLNFLGLGVGNLRLELCARSSHGQGGENRWPAKQYGEAARRQHHVLNVGALHRSPKITRLGDTIAGHVMTPMHDNEKM
jgi:hypothetical protein